LMLERVAFVLEERCCGWSWRVLCVRGGIRALLRRVRRAFRHLLARATVLPICLARAVLLHFLLSACWRTCRQVGWHSSSPK